MPFEIPDNLHPHCMPVAWLLGRWQGNGHGDYPTIEAFQFGQELAFTHDGRPFFHYQSRSWITDAAGEKVRDAAQETGYLRCGPEGRLELLLTHSTGVVEVWDGRAEAGRIELRTAFVGATPTAKPVESGHRLYGNVEGDLAYAYDMEAMAQELQPHIWARLARA